MKDCFVNKSRSRTALTNVEHLDKDTHAAHNSYVRLSEHLDKDALADVRLEHPPWRVMSRRVARGRRAPRVLLLRRDEELAVILRISYYLILGSTSTSLQRSGEIGKSRTPRASAFTWRHFTFRGCVRFAAGASLLKKRAGLARCLLCAAINAGCGVDGVVLLKDAPHQKRADPANKTAEDDIGNVVQVVHVLVRRDKERE